MDQLTQKNRVKEFVERWQKAEGNEDREAKSFITEFLEDVLGIDNRSRAVDFERRVKGRKIDAFYEDMGILIEAKSRKPGILDEQRNNGKYGFETPYQQAKWYANELPSSIHPRWIIVTDFDEFRIHDLDQESPERDYISVKLEDLPEQAYLFDFFHDKSQSRLIKEKELSVEAGEIVGKLYDAFAKQYKNLEESKEEQRSLNVLIVRLVFLLYAEDAGLFNEHQAFYKYMKGFNAEQSRGALINLFKMLDTPEDERDPYASEVLLGFPYVNGSLFSDEGIIVPQFTEDLRVELLLNASRGFDWKDISPTIFGAVFESTLNPDTRRSGGMHYTSIENIHKVIDPLFLDDLKAELAKIEGEKVERKRVFALREFQQKLANLNIFDPACGSGNFLTESYVQLRRLENRVLENIQGVGQASMDFGGDFDPIKVSIKQFYGIEINDFAVSVAKTALWIAESQMLTETQDIVQRYIDYFPLTTNAHIVEGNALRMDWSDVLPASKCSYVIGNPPFIGQAMQTREQSDEVSRLFPNVSNAGKLDYVAGWFLLATEYSRNTDIRCAFVSSNSISQGESVAALWKTLFDMGCQIDFAYTTFVWSSEASDKANVHVVIVGFSMQNHVRQKMLYNADGEIVLAQNINGYLKNAPNVFIQNRSKKMNSEQCLVTQGSQPMEDGQLLFTKEEMREFVRRYPDTRQLFRQMLGSREFLNDIEPTRYCLWLDNVEPEAYQDNPDIVERIKHIREYRLGNKIPRIIKTADVPHLFTQIRQPETDYLIIPRVSSARRKYIPIGYVSPDIIANDAVVIAANASLYDFGLLSSQTHNAWMRTVAGRLKSDYRYAPSVYYNFPYPDATDEQKRIIEQAAQALLDARDAHPGWSLAQLYDPDKMPADLLAAHKALDKAVENAYGIDFDGDEEKIVAHLFKLYSDTQKKAN